MDKQTNKRKEYITNPARIASFIVFVFWLWVAYASIVSRIQKLEDFQRSVDLVKIETTLREIQVDLSWVKNALSNK
jgi:hypothetical protein